MKAVIAEGLSKTYAPDKKALRDMHLAIEQGEVFGFLGPNGAGKTTAVKLLCGMLAPTAGSCRVLDIDPAKSPEKLHQLAGVVTEHAQMYDHLTGLQNLAFYGAVFGLSPAEVERRANTLLKQLNLEDAKDRKLAAYSTGMRQKLSLARAMLHHPQILFLDEPTSGLDPESAQTVNGIIRELAREGTTIFLCTHQLRYAQEICSSYGLIDEGSLLAAGTIEALRAMVSSGLTVRIHADRFPAGREYRATGPQACELMVNTQEEIPPIVKSIVLAGGNVYHVSAERMPLEDIYFSLIDMQKAQKEGEGA